MIVSSIVVAGSSGVAEAESLYRLALEIREKALPTGHPLIARSLSNLALLHITRGRLSEAEPLLKRAIEIWEKTLPAGHPDIATGRNNLGGLYDAQGRLAEAEPIYKRALEMREKALPAGHPDFASSGTILHSYIVAKAGSLRPNLSSNARCSYGRVRCRPGIQRSARI